ncbi:MAG: hypothetical protein JWP74_4034 [Marmoricola sp.]|nr:hypothetical protein [Marmoricola sp.]
MGKEMKLPKTECCVSKSRCGRCPIRMLKEGTLPAGYGVHKRVVVRVDGKGRPASTKAVKKAEIAAAVRKNTKSGKKKSLAA